MVGEGEGGATRDQERKNGMAIVSGTIQLLNTPSLLPSDSTPSTAPPLLAPALHAALARLARGPFPGWEGPADLAARAEPVGAALATLRLVLARDPRPAAVSTALPASDLKALAASTLPALRAAGGAAVAGLRAAAPPALAPCEDELAMGRVLMALAAVLQLAEEGAG